MDCQSNWQSGCRQSCGQRSRKEPCAPNNTLSPGNTLRWETWRILFWNSSEKVALEIRENIHTRPMNDTTAPPLRMLLSRKVTPEMIFRQDMNKWRRGRDSNPGYHYQQYNGLATHRFKPLSHLSDDEKKHLF